MSCVKLIKWFVNLETYPNKDLKFRQFEKFGYIVQFGYIKILTSLRGFIYSSLNLDVIFFFLFSIIIAEIDNKVDVEAFKKKIKDSQVR